MQFGYNTNGLANHSLESAICLLGEIGYRSVAITLDHSALTVDQFQLGEAQQEARVVHVLRGTESGKLLMLAQEGRQLELLEVMGEQDPRLSIMGGLAHGRDPPIRLI